jgi:hypothetical protein
MVLYLLMRKTVLYLTDTGATNYRFLMIKWQWDAVVTNSFIGPGPTAGCFALSVSVDGGFVELEGPGLMAKRTRNCVARRPWSC